MGGVALELMAAGKALVVSEKGGLAECCGPAALAFPNGDVDALAKALCDLLDSPQRVERLREEAQGDFEIFSTITLDFVVERIMIEGDNIDVFVHWQGLWKKDADDPGLRQRGHTRLQWVGTQSILLRGVQGDAPFGMKARQATTDSTRSPKKK